MTASLQAATACCVITVNIHQFLLEFAYELGNQHPQFRGQVWNRVEPGGVGVGFAGDRRPQQRAGSLSS
ncbi:MAG: hypothetical protein F6K32_01435 [Desertifilum sp. SIO1I2]|nr:hypothetical protein [Desertifilum sp. SIO1I2]